MEPRTLQYIQKACEGTLRGGLPGTFVSHVSTDSRSVSAGDLFVPLKGVRFDAHEFLADILKAKPAAALVNQDRLTCIPDALPVIVVDDTRKALGRLAAHYRRDFSLPSIAVVGSNGKTSTKEILATLLNQAFPTLASQASFNNDIGVPLTILQLGRAHKAAVFEVGTNHPGELQPLLSMVKPSIGIVTSIGREHLEFFGDLAGVVKEEGTIAETLNSDGTLILNGDCPHSRTIAARTSAKVITVGRDTQNDWRILGVRLHQNGTTFELKAPNNEFSGIYRLGLLGFHQVINATCAVVVGSGLGVGRNLLEAGLADCRPAKSRLELKHFGPVTVLDDSYNANADSMRAALQTLASFQSDGGKKIAVLGDMGELGPHAPEAHEEVGFFAGECQLSILIAIGNHSRRTADAARKAGVPQVLIFETVDAAKSALATHVLPGDVVLVKASRSSRLERVVGLIETQFAGEIVEKST